MLVCRLNIKIPYKGHRNVIKPLPLSYIEKLFINYNIDKTIISSNRNKNMHSMIFVKHHFVWTELSYKNYFQN